MFVTYNYQAIVKAKESERLYRSFFSSTKATIFFGTPHRGLVVDDILAMLGEASLRQDLVRSLTSRSLQLRTELKRFINCTTNLKIVSFKETELTRKLKQVNIIRFRSPVTRLTLE